MRVTGVPFDPARKTNGSLNPYAGVLHRTYGAWQGDYSVGKNAPGGTSFHFLVGKEDGQWVQFADTNAKCGHAPGANSSSIAIEFTGRNEQPLTEWQKRAGAWIIAATSSHHGIPLTYYDGQRRTVVSGWTNHASVAGSDHSDRVTPGDWEQMLAMIHPPPAPVTPAPDVTPPVVVNDAGADFLRKCYEWGSNQPLTSPGDSHLGVAQLQQYLNAIYPEAGLKVDGDYGNITKLWTMRYQTEHGLAVDAVVGTHTWARLLADRLALGR